MQMQFSKKIFSFILITLIFLMPAYSQATVNDNDFTVKVTQSTLTKMTNPVDFATVIYGLVVAQEELSTRRDYENNLAKLVFTKDLYEKYKKADSSIDFRIFTSAQDVMNSFWIGKVTATATETSVPVFLGFAGDNLDSKKPTVTLQLFKTAEGWKINDLVYPTSTLRSQLQVSH